MKAKYTDFKTKKIVICHPHCHNVEILKLLVILVAIRYNMLVLQYACFRDNTGIGYS